MDDCIRGLREVANGRGNVTVAQGLVSTLEAIVRFSPASTETVQAHALIAAVRAFELRVLTNPLMARHELELAVLRACE